MNPYKVLGVSENATKEEIRAAYLTLVKKYHPDKYTDTPLKELAGEKIKEINQAYEMLTKKPSSGASSSGSYGQQSYGQQSYGGYQGYQGYQGYSYGGAQGSYTGPNAAEYARARGYINNGELNYARSVLDGIQERGAEWYFLYGIIYLRSGWYEKAREYIRRAYEQQPDNAEYRSAYATLNNTGRAYRQNTGTSVFGGNPVCCSFLPAICLVDFCTGGCCC